MSGRCGGWDHTVFLDHATGVVWACGQGNDGQLGLGDSIPRLTIHAVPNLPPIQAVACGGYHTACVSTDGRLYCFGRGSMGQLGTGQSQDQGSPQQVKGLPPIRSVACGFDFTVCIGCDDTIWSFGSNTHGQLGVGTTTASNIPVQIPVLTACQVACGAYHTLLLDLEGKIWACGSNEHGQLGCEGELNVLEPRHTAHPFDDDVHTIFCGWQHSMVLTNPRQVWVTGHNDQFELGLDDQTDRFRWHGIPNLHAQHVACGWQHTMIIGKDHTLWGWGRDFNGCLSRGTAQIPVILREDAVMVLAGFFGTFLCTKENKVYCCGLGDHGQLGMDDRSDRATWVQNELVPPHLFRLPATEDFNKPLDWEGYRTALHLTPAEEKQLRAITTHVRRTQWSLPHEQRPCVPLALGSWQQSVDTVTTLYQRYQESLNAQRVTELQQDWAQHQALLEEVSANIMALQQQLAQEQQRLEELKNGPGSLDQLISKDQERVEVLYKIIQQSKQLSDADARLLDQLENLLIETPFHSLSAECMELVWWRMGLAPHASEMQRQGIDGELVLDLNHAEWMALGLSRQEACQAQFMTPFFTLDSWRHVLERLEEEECLVCMHATPESTWPFLEELRLPFDSTLMKEEGWTVPFLIYAAIEPKRFGIPPEALTRVIKEMRRLRRIHEQHLADLREEEEK